LEEQYNLSRPTIRQAIDLLERQGYLYRVHGRGTFVSPPKLQKGMLELTSFSEDMRNRGLTPAGASWNSVISNQAPRSPNNLA
jgi:GntR family transcriptional regulator